jgi:AcrR family transcriptional regulator
MVKKNKAISVSAVAREAGVSRPTIRRRKDILALIQKLATAPTPVILAVPDDLNGESAVVSALRRHVREQAEAHRTETAALRAEIQRLKTASPRHLDST